MQSALSSRLSAGVHCNQRAWARNCCSVSPAEWHIRSKSSAAGSSGCRGQGLALLSTSSSQKYQCRPLAIPGAALAAITAANVSTTVTSSTAITIAVWAPLLTSAGVFVVCIAAAVLLLAAVPTLWAMTSTARRAESLLATIEREVPDTAASMRLSSLEVSDCINELAGLGGDLSGGLRSTARLATAAEASIRTGAAVMVPVLARTESVARDKLESSLQQRASLPYGTPNISKLTGSVRKLRAGVQAAGLLGQVLNVGQALRSRVGNIAAAYQRPAPREAVATDKGAS